MYAVRGGTARGMTRVGSTQLSLVSAIALRDPWGSARLGIEGWSRSEGPHPARAYWAQVAPQGLRGKSTRL